jgi:hypothetical protein
MGFDALFEPARALEQAAQLGARDQVAAALAVLRHLAIGILRGARSTPVEVAEADA